jgi:tRNA(Ile)-lysidine synthetase-like protein
VFIRPLLNVRGGNLREFLMSKGISGREDSTNADICILRNKVRHVILPFLEKELDPKIVEHICRSAKYLREASAGGSGPFVPVPEKSDVCESEKEDSRYSLTVEHAVGYEVISGEIGALPACCWFDAEALKGRDIEVRRWRDGDWMRPCGFPHRRKLQDIFVTAKTPPSVRKTLPIIADAKTSEVLWIPGYRVSESIKVSSMTAASVRLRLALLRNIF